MKRTCVAVVTLGLLAPSTAIAHQVLPSKAQAVRKSLTKGERTFVQQNDRRWRHARTNCQFRPNGTIWRCVVHVDGGGVSCVYRINVVQRDSDNKVVARLKSTGCIA